MFLLYEFILVLNFFIYFAEALSTTWSRKKYYCRYKKEEKEFLMISYNQLLGKMVRRINYAF